MYKDVHVEMHVSQVILTVQLLVSACLLLVLKIVQHQ